MKNIGLLDNVRLFKFLDFINDNCLLLPEVFSILYLIVILLKSVI